MLEKVIEELRAEITLLRAENVKLRAWIEELLIQAGKNSGNSSKPPSTDALAKEAGGAHRGKAEGDAWAPSGAGRGPG